jgi:hypothetical protein
MGRHAITVCGFALVSSLGRLASAQSVTWQQPSIHYDTGALPSVTVYADDNPSVAQLEVHQGGAPDLWYHDGGYEHMNGSNRYDGGFFPTVASTGGGSVYEVHQSGSGVSPLYMHTGFDYDPNGPHVTWFSAFSLGQSGFHPVLATNGGSGLLAVVEVHQVNAGTGPLWINVGQPAMNTSSTVPFLGTTFNNGTNPTVAITYIGPYAKYFIIEVHQAADGIGPLWEDSGILTIDTSGSWRIVWNQTSQFTNGVNPSIAICSNDYIDDIHFARTKPATVVQVNEGSYGDLWSHTGKMNADGSFSWIAGSDQHYDNGHNPKISCTQFGSPVGMEVHAANAAGAGGALWFRGFSAN